VGLDTRLFETQRVHLPREKNTAPPTPVEIPADSSVEMTWLVFGGEHHELYLALLKARCVRDGLDTGDETLLRQFRLHLYRGIGYVAAPQFGELDAQRGRELPLER
jgi:hypothetical protein